MTHGEPDFTKRTTAKIDHWYLKGVELLDPTIAKALPISIENPALAYDSANDRFKVDIEAVSAGAFPVDITDDWTRQLGQVDLARVLGAALSHSNPVIARLTDGTDFIDPRNIRTLTSSDVVTVNNLLNPHPTDVSDRAARLLGIVYGNLAQLQQRDSTYDLLVQLRHEGSEIDPRNIRALTSSDIITAVQPTASNLNATVTQAEKDRTISSVDATGTPIQIDNTWTGAADYTVHTPASGKKIRLKFISLELSADVDLGYKFGSSGTLYYLRTTKGPYVSNLIGCNTEGAVDEALILNASGACTVKGYVILEEI